MKNLMQKEYTNKRTTITKPTTTIPSTGIQQFPQQVFTHWQKKTMSQYLLPEVFKTFSRSA